MVPYLNILCKCPNRSLSMSTTGIPMKPYFDFSKEDIECLKLKEYKVDLCGSLVFVCISDTKISLKEFLGDFYSEIEKMSNSFGLCIDINEIKIKANWKVLVENTLESYHVNLVHKDSFRKLGAKGMEFKFVKNHSKWDADLLVKEEDKKVKRIHANFKNRKYKIEGYNHLLVFPNTLISSTYGISFNLTQILPVDENNSLFISYVFLTKTLNELPSSPIIDMYKSSLIDFNRQVFDEDKDICENVQIGVNFSDYDGELSDEERRVCEFQKSYSELMNSNE